MAQIELLARVVGVLDAAGVEHMVTGSLASSLHGEPRSTHDIDLVVALPASAVDAIVHAFPSSDYYVDEAAARSAIAGAASGASSMFNLIEADTGDKVDFWILTPEPFDQSRFRRRVKAEVDGLSIWVSSPEDTILMKLRWAAMGGGSERQLRDARGVYEVNNGTLDESYLDGWAVRLGVVESLACVREGSDL